MTRIDGKECRARGPAGRRGRAPYSNTALQRARPIRVRGRRRSVSSEQSERKEILYREK